MLLYTWHVASCPHARIRGWERRLCVVVVAWRGSAPPGRHVARWRRARAAAVCRIDSRAELFKSAVTNTDRFIAVTGGSGLSSLNASCCIRRRSPRLNPHGNTPCACRIRDSIYRLHGCLDRRVSRGRISLFRHRCASRPSAVITRRRTPTCRSSEVAHPHVVMPLTTYPYVSIYPHRYLHRCPYPHAHAHTLPRAHTPVPPPRCKHTLPGGGFDLALPRILCAPAL